MFLHYLVGEDGRQQLEGENGAGGQEVGEMSRALKGPADGSLYQRLLFTLRHGFIKLLSLQERNFIMMTMMIIVILDLNLH